MQRPIMEEKYNNSTQQRPEGARPLDAAIIPIDVPKYINQLKHEEAYDRNGKNAITVFKSERITVTLIVLKKGQDFHPGKNEDTAIMSVQLISGELTFESLGTLTHLKDGELLMLHQQLSFKATAILESSCLLTLFK
ncbi:hypothetical protein WG904_15415 [Pedobacter sp. Du54]|uniref:hypothetical protein n=1 Tax=Pedobacter anseongensis TaxID=3133439 RepID=UPI0030A13246